MKPNFLLIGAPKAGTTSLWDILRQHPEIFMATPKEPRFFCNDEAYARGWSWYESLFADAGNAKAIGEASPSYCMIKMFPNALPRIAKHLPEAKIIYVVRHPLDRIESTWLQCLHTGHPMPRSFRRAVRKYAPIVESSMYWQTLSAYRKIFPDERIAVLFFEDFKDNPKLFLRDCFRFLGIDENYDLPDTVARKNVSAEHIMPGQLLWMMRRNPFWERIIRVIPQQAKRPFHKWAFRRVPDRPTWDPATRQWVLDQVAEDTRRLLEYTGKPADFWKL